VVVLAIPGAVASRKLLQANQIAAVFVPFAAGTHQAGGVARLTTTAVDGEAQNSRKNGKAYPHV
jgi:hypothetical protein